METHKTLIQKALLLAACGSLPLVSHAVISVSFSAGEDYSTYEEPLFATSDGTAVPAGNSIWVGHIVDPAAVTAAKDNFPTVVDMFDTFAIKDGAFWTPSGVLADNKPAGGASLNLSGGPTSLDDFGRKRISIMVIKTTDNGPLNTTDYSNLEEYGIFSSTDDTGTISPAWLFPSVDNGLALTYSDIINQVTVGGTLGTNDSGTAEFLTLHAPTIIPEPSTYAAIFGLLTLAFAALRRRRT